MSVFDAALRSVIGGLRAADPRSVFYTPAGGDELELLEAYFQAAGTTLELVAGVPAAARAPRLLWRPGALGVTPREDDTFRVDGVVYRVVAVDEDGAGGFELTGEEISS